MAKGQEAPRFLTIRQARQIGAIVRKGEKGIPILYFGTALSERETESETGQHRYRFARISYVFHVSQFEVIDLEALRPVETVPIRGAQGVAAVDRWIEGLPVKVENRNLGAALYDQSPRRTRGTMKAEVRGLVEAIDRCKALRLRSIEIAKGGTVRFTFADGSALSGARQADEVEAWLQEHDPDRGQGRP